MLRASLPVAESLQERGFGFAAEIVDGQHAGCTDGCAQLLDVLGAAVAAGEMVFERAHVARAESALEVVGDELDELLAAEGFGVDHVFTGAR